ncbi:hypothetical protein KQX54_005086 [Cotesia glomerata]|uniref:Aminopeptidase n=1 Tax=Cotesia glomerata TaxID=32391 RepID=A0AAV7IW24_COTGL|nr:hypothetical protein KQX54_005086 [Cotesia glomerata]
MVTSNLLKSLVIFVKTILYGIFILSHATLSSASAQNRLPGHFIPVHYTINIIPYIEENNFTFDGESLILIEAKIESNIIILHAKNLQIKENITLNNASNKYESNNYTIDTKNDFLSIVFNEKIVQGNYTLHLKYCGVINDKLQGFYRSTYTGTFGKKQWLVSTHFETNNARQAFPCWDEPAFKATFKISIKHNRRFTALSNTRFNSICSTNDSSNHVWTQFEKTPLMSSYLIAFIVGDLDYLAHSENETFRIWTRKNAASRGEMLLSNGFKALKSLENFFGMSYQDHGFKKIDLVVIPEMMSIGVENWGIIFLKENEFFSTENIERKKIGKNDFMDLTHELSHQWFGNLVTHKWWKYLWLTEGLASAVIIRMIKYVLGDENFRKGIRNYLNNNKFGVVTSDNFFNELTEVSGNMNVTLDKALNNWQSTPGYPMITINRNYTSNKATITQSRFLRHSNLTSTDQYWIPLNFATQDNMDFNDTAITHWLDPDSISLEISAPESDKWLMSNKHQSGYYRVNYDEKNWQLIANYLNSENYYKIHYLNRGQLIDDALTLADEGYVSYSIVLELMEYLRYETDPLPWATFFNNLRQLHASSLPHSSYYESYKKIISTLLKNIEKNVFVDKTTDENMIEMVLKKSIIKWSCLFGSNLCKNYTLSIISKWLENFEENPLPMDIKSEILCGGMRYVDENTWNAVLMKYLENRDKDILQALSCTSNVTFLNKMLFLAMNNTFNELDRWDFFLGITAESNGLETTLNFINDYRTKIEKSSASAQNRLPGHFIPVHYTINIIPYIEENNFTFDGESLILIEAKIESNIIILHAKNLQIKGNITLNNASNKYESNNYTIDTKNDFLSIVFNEKIVQGNYTLHLKYCGVINDNLQGFYRSTYTDTFGDKQWLVSTNFEPNYARQAFPCWDEPAFKATFQISIKHNRRFTALSNTRFNSILSTNDSSNHVWTQFEKTPLMSSYLIAFIVGDLDYLAHRENKTFRIWTRKNAASRGEMLLSNGFKALKSLENFLGMSYQDHGFKKIDLVVIPEMMTFGMENWGIIFLKENDFFSTENIESKKIGKNDLINLTHELNHNWFGNLVTHKWWKYLWLTEGLASAVIIRMIKYVLGDENFRKGIRNYLNNNKFGVVTSDNFFNELTKVSGNMNVTLEKALNNWESTPGYPMITINRNYGLNTATITQSRFLQYSDLTSTDQYWIPLNFATQDNMDFNDTAITHWLEPDSISLEISAPESDKWLISNKQQFGYYRVNYDEKNWQLIVNYLNSENYYKIHYLNRAQLIDDAFTLAFEGYVSYSIVFELMEYLRYETDSLPWATFLDNIYRLQGSSLPHSSYYESYKKIILTLLQNIEKNVFVDKTTDENMIEMVLKKSIIKWSCLFGSNLCKNYTLSIISKWLENFEENPLPMDIKSEILCGGMRYVDENTWNAVLMKYLENRDKDILQALSCTSNVTFLNKMLFLAMNNTFNELDRWDFFLGITTKDNGLETTLNFINDYRTKIEKSDSRYEFLHDGIIFIRHTVRNNSQFSKWGELLKNVIGEKEATKYLVKVRSEVDRYNLKLNLIKNYFEKRVY